MIFVHINVNDPFARRISVYSHELNVNKEISVEFSDENGAINLDDYTVTATFVCNKFFITDEVVVKKESQTGVVKLDIGSTDSYTILPGEMLIEFRIAKSNRVIYPVTAMVVDVYPSIKDDAQVTPQSYGTVAEILQEVAEARGNYNNLNARLDNIELNKMTFTNLGTVSSYDEAIFQNNKNTGTVYAVNMSGTSYWFFNVKIGTDVSIQYRFSKNGIEVYNTVLQEWMNIGGKGGEIVTARKTFATLGHRLNSIDSDIATLDNSKLPFTVLPTSSTYSESVFSNNQATGTVYAVNMNGTSYWFFNVKIGADVSIQYRFSKNGIEIKGGSMTEWLNIGGKGDEVVAARGGFADLDARLDDMGHDIETLIVEVNQGIPSDLAGKMNVKTATGSPDTAFDNNLDLQTVYHVGINPNLFYFVNLDDSTQLRYNYSIGFEFRQKVNNTWGEWESTIPDNTINSAKLAPSIRLLLEKANHSVQFVDLGVKTSETEFDSADYTVPDTKFVFDAVGSLATLFNLSSGTTCELVYDGSWQIVQPVTKDYKYIRYVTSTDPFTADSWIVVGADKTRFVDLGTDSSGTVFSGNRDLDTIYQVYYQGVNYKFLNISANLQMRFSNWPRTIEVKNYSDQTPVWKNIGGAPGEIADARGTFNSLKLRLDDSDSTLSGKLDYIDDSDNLIMNTAAFNSYDFDSNKLYQVMLNGMVLGAYEPAQIALVFQSDWDTRIILGAKSGVFYSTYDSQTEEWSDPVKSLDKATERQLNNFEQRISALETANTILSNAINGVVSE